MTNTARSTVCPFCGYPDDLRDGHDPTDRLAESPVLSPLGCDACGKWFPHAADLVVMADAGVPLAAAVWNGGEYQLECPAPGCRWRTPKSVAMPVDDDTNNEPGYFYVVHHARRHANAVSSP